VTAVEVVAVAFIVIYAALSAWVVYEFVTAPLVDEQGRVIKDRYGRMRGRRLRVDTDASDEPRDAGDAVL
jgi:hypothetical protein